MACGVSLPSWIRIRILNPDPDFESGSTDLFESRSGSETLVSMNSFCCVGRGVYPGAWLRRGAGLDGRPGRLLPRGGVPRPRLRAARHSHRAPLPAGAVRPPAAAAGRRPRLRRPLHWLVGLIKGLPETL